MFRKFRILAYLPIPRVPASPGRCRGYRTLPAVYYFSYLVAKLPGSPIRLIDCKIVRPKLPQPQPKPSSHDFRDYRREKYSAGSRLWPLRALLQGHAHRGSAKTGRHLVSALCSRQGLPDLRDSPRRVPDLLLSVARRSGFGRYLAARALQNGSLYRGHGPSPRDLGRSGQSRRNGGRSPGIRRSRLGRSICSDMGR